MRLFKLVSALSFAALTVVAGCGEDKTASTQDTNSTAKQLRIGISPGPYDVMIKEGIMPTLKEQGYDLQIIEFTDYVQPNLALESGDIDANLSQHTAYLNNLVATQGVKIQVATTVPSLGMGLFSNKVTALPGSPNFDDKQEAALKGGTVGMPNDAINFARALKMCSKLNLIKINDKVTDLNKMSVADIIENPWGLEFVPMESAQLTRSLDSITMAFIPGNYAGAAHFDYNKALGVENVDEDLKSVIAVRLGDSKTKEIFEKAVQSPFFKQAVSANHNFDNFSRPQWWDTVKANQKTTN